MFSAAITAKKSHCDRDGSGGESIHIIEEIDGIHQQHEPEDRRGPDQERVGDEDVDPDVAESDHQQRNEELTAEFHLRRKRPFVVDQPQQHGEKRAENQDGELGELGAKSLRQSFAEENFLRPEEKNGSRAETEKPPREH